MEDYMIKIEVYDNYVDSKREYGGHAGQKRGILIDGENWFLKFPKSTKSMEKVNRSYTTSPISEYLGSHIYESIGIDVHKTKLGICDGKIVVACKDFLKDKEVLLDYNAIKNRYIRVVDDEIDNSLNIVSENDIDDIIKRMNNNIYFLLLNKFRSRFWEMFIIDSFISNNDRNSGNWGLIRETRDGGEISIAPVFDNGASFYNKMDYDKMVSLYNDPKKFIQVAYDSSISVFEKNGKPINPLKYIESMENLECNAALMRIVPLIDMKKIENIFMEIPNSYNGIEIISDIQKKFYLKVLNYRFENILLPVYNKLKKDYKN